MTSIDGVDHGADEQVELELIFNFEQKICYIFLELIKPFHLNKTDVFALQRYFKINAVRWLWLDGQSEFYFLYQCVGFELCDGIAVFGWEVLLLKQWRVIVDGLKVSDGSQDEKQLGKEVCDVLWTDFVFQSYFHFFVQDG